MLAMRCRLGALQNSMDPEGVLQVCHPKHLGTIFVGGFAFLSRADFHHGNFSTIWTIEHWQISSIRGPEKVHFPFAENYRFKLFSLRNFVMEEVIFLVPVENLEFQLSTVVVLLGGCHLKFQKKMTICEDKWKINFFLWWSQKKIMLRWKRSWPVVQSENYPPARFNYSQKNV